MFLPFLKNEYLSRSSLHLVVTLPSFTIVELYTLHIFALVKCIFCKSLIPVSWLFFQLLILFFVVSICNHFISITFVVCVLGMSSKKSLCVPVFPPYFLPVSHKILHLVLWSILILVLCMKSTFIFGIWVSSFPSTVYGESVISSIYVLGIFVKNHLTVSTWRYFWVLCPVDMCISSFVKSFTYESVSLVILLSMNNGRNEKDEVRGYLFLLN